MKKINETFNVIIKSLYYSILRFILFYTVSVVMLNIKFNNNFMLLFTLLIHIVVFAICSLFDENIILNLSTRNRGIILVSFAIIGMIICSYGYNLFSYLFTFIYFVIISIISIKNGVSFVKSSVEAFKSIVLVFILASVYASDKTIVAFDNKIIDYILVYFITGFIYLLSNNFNNYYDNENSINKKKNLIILNSISTAIIISLVFFKDKIILLLQNVSRSISSYTDKLLNDFANALNYLANSILNEKFTAFVENFIKKHNESGIVSDTNTVEKATEAVKDIMQSDGGAVDFGVLYNLVFIIFAVILAVLLFLSLKHFKYKRNTKSKNIEKEFIFKKEEIIKEIKDNIKSIFKKREILSPERTMYKNTVIKLIDDGYDLQMSTTPNEYIKTVKQKDIDKYDFDELTKRYNKCRYGKN